MSRIKPGKNVEFECPSNQYLGNGDTEDAEINSMKKMKNRFSRSWVI